MHGEPGENLLQISPALTWPTFGIGHHLDDQVGALEADRVDTTKLLKNGSYRADLITVAYDTAKPPGEWVAAQARLQERLVRLLMGAALDPDCRRSLVRNWAPQRRLDRPCPPPAPGGAAPGCSSDQGRCELVARSSIRGSCRRDTGCAHGRGIRGPARHPAKIRREHRSPRQWPERRLHDRDEAPAVPKARSPKGEEAGGDAPRRARRLGDARDLPRPAPRPRSLPPRGCLDRLPNAPPRMDTRFSAIGYSSSIVSQRSLTGSSAYRSRLDLRPLQRLGHRLRAGCGVCLQLELRALHRERDHVAEEQALDLERVDVVIGTALRTSLTEPPTPMPTASPVLTVRSRFFVSTIAAGGRELDARLLGSGSSLFLLVAADCLADSERAGRPPSTVSTLAAARSGRRALPRPRPGTGPSPPRPFSPALTSRVPA